MQTQAQGSSSAPPLDTVYHAPIPPKIPMNHVQSLIPRLTTTINDIDSFRNLLAQGGQDGTMPNWDVTLQRYSLLLARITALSNYISQPPPTPAPAPGQTRTPLPPPSLKPALQSYLAHPLNPLPLAGTADVQVSPFAPDVYFQVLNTLPLPALSEATDNLLRTDMATLKKLDEAGLDGMERSLKERLKRESERAKGLVEEIERRSGEVEWTMRVNEDDGEEEDGSLFGGESDSDAPIADKTATEIKEDAAKLPDPPNPMEGWSIQDYVKFMETGTKPASS